MHIRTAAFRCSDDPGFGLCLWFFDAGQKFAHELAGGVGGGRDDAIFRSLHSGWAARSWADCLCHPLSTIYRDEKKTLRTRIVAMEEKITCGRVCVMVSLTLSEL